VTLFLLIRHAETADLGRRLSGDLPVNLTENGRRQAARLVERLAGCPLDALYSSPLARARSTAAPLAAALDLPVAVLAEAAEVGFGDWQGRLFRELDPLPQWRHYNRRRCEVRPPGGELSVEVQARFAAALQRLHAERPAARIAIVSHSDTIRYALAFFLGLALDLSLRLQLDPASVCAVAWGDESVRVLCINNTERLPLD
jgi:probable phosphoglycerate mutase